MRSLFLEDFTPGQRFMSDEVLVSAEDLRTFARVSGDRHPSHLPIDGLDGDGVDVREASAHGPLGIARYYGTVFDAGVLADSLVGALDVHWHFGAPLRANVPVHYETLVTGWRRSRSMPSRGIVFRTIRLKDADGAVLQHGSSTVAVKAHRSDARDDPAWSLPLSPEWARSLVTHLEDDVKFHDSTQLFDGTIGLTSGDAECQLRIYKGQVLEVAPRTPRGASFTLHADPATWCELLASPRNELVARTHRGELATSGDAYAYLQLTKALHILVDAGRSLWPTSTRTTASSTTSSIEVSA
jgi:acyl dehydratase